MSMIEDFISDSTLRMAAKAPDVEPPVREAFHHADKFGPQFQGLVGSSEVPATPARHPYRIGGENGPSVHQWRNSSPGIKESGKYGQR
jgi:hypothetical protein